MDGSCHVRRKRLQKVEQATNVLQVLPQAHLQFTLLRFCLHACRVNDLLRACPIGMAKPEVLRFSKVIQGTLEGMMGVSLTPAQWSQATLAIRCGGLGIGDPVRLRAAARLSGLVNFLKQGPRCLGIERTKELVPLDTVACIGEMVERVGEMAPLLAWRQDVEAVGSAESPHDEQRWWTQRVMVAEVERLAKAGDNADMVRFACQRDAHAGAWLAAVPSSATRTLIPGTEFRTLLRWWLGVPLLAEDQVGAPCPLCGTAMDVLGHHLVCCKQNKPMRRHMAIQDTLVAISRRAGLSCRKEERTPENSRPGDVFYPRWDTDGPAAVDATVRDPRIPSQPLQQAEAVPKWRERQEADKVSRHGNACKRLGWTFVPFVVDVWGGLGEKAKAFMGVLVKAIVGQREGWQRRQVEASVWQDLSMALARELGRQLAWHVHAREGPTEVAMVSHAPYCD